MLAIAHTVDLDFDQEPHVLASYCRGSAASDGARASTSEVARTRAAVVADGGSGCVRQFVQSIATGARPLCGAPA